MNQPNQQTKYLGPLRGGLADGHHGVVERAGLPDAREEAHHLGLHGLVRLAQGVRVLDAQEVVHDLVCVGKGGDGGWVWVSVVVGPLCHAQQSSPKTPLNPKIAITSPDATPHPKKNNTQATKRANSNAATPPHTHNKNKIK